MSDEVRQDIIEYDQAEEHVHFDSVEQLFEWLDADEEQSDWGCTTADLGVGYP